MSKSGYITDNSNLKKVSGMPSLSFNARNNVFFERNPENIAYEVSSTQLPAMVGGSFVDLFMSKNHMRELHWHPNAWELDVYVSGHAIVSIMNPDQPQLVNYELSKPGDVVFIPMGWFHWITALEDHTHLHLFFNNDQVESAEFSDILRLTPASAINLVYNISEKEWEEAVAPVAETVVIGPVQPSIQADKSSTKPNRSIPAPPLKIPPKK